MMRSHAKTIFGWRGLAVCAAAALSTAAWFPAGAQAPAYNELPDAAVRDFVRTGSTSQALAEAAHQSATPENPLSLTDLIVSTPMIPRGLPGVALLDYDGDGDLDLYATNGPGSPNALLANQLEETGSVSFVDVTGEAGVEAIDQDSFGVCFGDTDNDGDPDLLVLGRNEPGRFFENLGDGSFVELFRGAATGNYSSSGCSMADFDGDGLLDIVVGNSFDQTIGSPIFGLPVYDANHPNQLFFNVGDNTFEDRSLDSGITENGGYYEGRPGITWAVGAVDVDADGDVDIVFADDQGAVPPERARDLHPPDFPLPIEDRSYIHVFLNDGTGHFVDRPITETPFAASEWMGLAFGDLNCDGHLDLFATSFGDYGNVLLAVAYDGGSASRWFLGNGDGSFEDVGVGDLQATPFGWGAAIYDADNDADLDVLFHGGLDAANMVNIADNPGALLLNQSCSAEFVADTQAITADHISRNVRAVAVGDLDRDGFVDVVTGANFRANPQSPQAPMPIQYGSPFDDTAFFYPILVPVTPPTEFPPRFVWTGVENLDGDLMVELSAGDNGNASATIALRGSVGDLAEAQVNRDGIGALLSFTPRGGPTVRHAMVGGSSHSSQHALERVFGMGTAPRGQLDVLWPGGVRNRLYGVRAGEHLVVPEIPCSYDTNVSLRRYLRCVVPALETLRQQRVVSRRLQKRLFVSAVRAYLER